MSDTQNSTLGDWWVNVCELSSSLYSAQITQDITPSRTSCMLLSRYFLEIFDLLSHSNSLLVAYWTGYYLACLLCKLVSLFFILRLVAWGYTIYSNWTDLYYASFPNDRHKVKGLVIIIMLIESVQTAMVFVAAYRVFVTGCDSEDCVLWSDKIVLGVLGITGGLCKISYFAYHKGPSNFRSYCDDSSILCMETLLAW